MVLEPKGIGLQLARKGQRSNTKTIGSESLQLLTERRDTVISRRTDLKASIKVNRTKGTPSLTKKCDSTQVST